MPEPTNTFFQAYRPPPPAAIQPNRPYSPWPHPRSRLWKTWNVDDMAPPPPPPRKRTSGKFWIYELPDFGVTKLKRVKSMAAGLVGKVEYEALPSKDSLVPELNSEVEKQSEIEEKGKEPEDCAVLNSSKMWNEENIIEPDHDDTESSSTMVTVPNIMLTERLHTESLDYCISKPPDLPNPDVHSWGEAHMSYASYEITDVPLPDPISSDSSSSDDWWSGDGSDDNARSLQDLSLSSSLYGLEEGIHIHFPSWRKVTSPSLLWNPKYLNNLFFYRLKLQICFCVGRGRR